MSERAAPWPLLAALALGLGAGIGVGYLLFAGGRAATSAEHRAVVTSPAARTLYRGSANVLSVDVPSLGRDFDPVFEAATALLTPGRSDKRQVTVEPTDTSVVLVVSSRADGRVVRLDELRFRVIEPPRPSIAFTVNGQAWNGNAVPSTSRIQVRLVPDPGFASAFPEDARYAISAIEVLAHTSLGPPAKVADVAVDGTDATRPIVVPLGAELRQLRPGTTVQVRVKDVFRINHRDERAADDRFTLAEKTLTLVVR